MCTRVYTTLHCCLVTICKDGTKAVSHIHATAWLNCLHRVAKPMPSTDDDETPNLAVHIFSIPDTGEGVVICGCC